MAALTLKKTSAGVIALALSFATAYGATPPPDTSAPASKDLLSVLIKQGKYWQAHRRGDLAEQAWLKVLQIDPQQPDALYGMGMVFADRKDGNGAQQYLARLRQAAPDYPEIDSLGRRLGDVSERDQSIDDARRLAQTGQSASAVQAYQRALNGKPASPDLQREYYQTLSATPQGWAEARRGLEQLARDNPDDPRYALAYAQHLTYGVATRREGIARLATLAGDTSVGADARKSWRQALLWLDARASDAPLYQAYLESVNDDAAVKARFDSMVQQNHEARKRAQQNAASGARGRAVAEGFAAFDRGDLTDARARFSAVLASSPNDSDALGGMGIVALKQERFDEARNYLERASTGGKATRWKSALASATYWTYTSDALGASSNGDFAKAKSLFEHAIAINPSDVTAQVLLGDMLLKNGNAAGAEQAYRMALRRQADNPDAIRGLVGALAAQGRGDEALQFANQLTAGQQSKAGGINRLRGEAQAAQARAAEARGDLGSARSLFEDALLNDSDDMWLRLDLARIYVRQGAVANARSMMDGLLATNPDMPDALYASALLAAETQDWSAGLAQLEKVPTAKRTAAMTTLQHRLWVHQQADLAAQLARGRQTQQAFATLRAAEPVAGRNAELIGALATGYLNTGDTNHALQLMRSALNAAPANTDLLLQYAGTLLATRQDAELGTVMRRLAATQMTAQQRRDFDKLNLAIVIRQADAIRQRGDLAGAYDAIAPWLAATPDDPDLQAALGRLYVSSGDDRNALASFKAALARRPDDVGLLMAATTAATSAKEYRYAESLAAKALSSTPDDPQVLATVGRMYHAEGKSALAAKYLERSLVAANTPPAGSGRSTVPRNWDQAMRRIGATPLPGTNPFAGKTAVPGPTDTGASVSTPATYGVSASLPLSQSLLPTPTVPNYLPPSQPAPYVAPYVAPRVAPVNTLSNDAADSGYGSDTYYYTQSGGPAVSPDDYTATPWPVSPAAHEVQANPERATAPAIPPSTRKKTTARKVRNADNATANNTPTQYGQPAYPQQAYYAQPATQQPVYGQQAWEQQQAYAQQRYAQQQGYVPTPPRPVYVSQPYIPQPPSGYAQPYYAQQAVAMTGYVDSNDGSDGSYASSTDIASSQTLSVAEELAQINREQASTVSGGVLFRNRAGESGLSALTDIEAPVEGRIRAGNGQVVVRVTPVTLDAGTAATDQNTLSRFGVGATSASAPTPGSQNATGVGVSVGYENRYVKTDVGTTPIGFRETNVVGGVQYHNAITDQTTYTITASQRAVTDSLVAYAGATATDANGKTYRWGGVLSHALRGDLTWDDGTSGVYLTGQFLFLTGDNVENNTGGKGGGGFYTRLVKSANQTLTAGVNTTVMSYAKNESYFTYGQGGYFSPQFYVLLNFPVEFTGRSGAFTYDLKGSIGVQHFRESSVAYFPTSSSLQSSAVSAAITPDANATYPGLSKTGFAYSLAVTGEYRLAPQLTVGATASLGNSYQYREWVAAVYARYSFTKQSGVSPFSPSPLNSPYVSMSN